MPRSRARPAQPAHTLRIHLRVCGSFGGALGPGRVELLEHIDATGSIREAAQRMEMSYNRAWTLVRSLNESFQNPLVIASRGGDRRGGAELTEEGRQILALFRSMEARATLAVERSWKELRERLKS
jgi:molybdate transport system regulatory protein